MIRKRLKLIICFLIVFSSVFICAHYGYVYGLQTIKSSTQAAYRISEPSSASSSIDFPESFNKSTISQSEIKLDKFSPKFLSQNLGEMQESMSARLNVSRHILSQAFFTAVNKVVYLKFQNEMDIYWKNPVELHNVKGLVLIFHSCKYNGQEWWSLLRDNISFSHFRFQYSLPNEVRIASGFLQAGYMIVALAPVKNQNKNGCWVKDDRTYIPAVVEYFRSLRILSYQHAQKQQKSSHSSVLSSLFSSNHPLSKEQTRLPVFALGITNGGAFLNQQLRYWMNPVPDTPPPSHPYHNSPQQRQHQPQQQHRPSTKQLEDEEDEPHHGFAGRKHAQQRFRKGINQQSDRFPSEKYSHKSRRLADIKSRAPASVLDLQSLLLANQPSVTIYPPVYFDSIILMNSGIWHKDYFPPSKSNSNHKATATSDLWAFMPPVLFVDYSRNGDVVWHNAKTLQQLRSLDSQRSAVLLEYQHSLKTAGTEAHPHWRTRRDGREFASHLISDPLPLYPRYFLDQLSVLFPAELSAYPKETVRFSSTAVGDNVASRSNLINNPFGSDATSDAAANRHYPNSFNHSHAGAIFSLPFTVIFTPEDSAHLFFSLYVGDVLNRDESERLHEAFRQLSPVPAASLSLTESISRGDRLSLNASYVPRPLQATASQHWHSVLSEVLAEHHRDGIERYVWPGSNVLFKDVAGHIHLPRTLKLCHRSAPDFFRDVDHLNELDKHRQDHGLHSPSLQALRKAWGWRETNDEYIAEVSVHQLRSIVYLALIYFLGLYVCCIE